MVDSNNISIKLFRVKNGMRTPHILVLDRERNVISEEVDPAELERILSNPFLVARHMVDAPAGLDGRAALALHQQGLYAEVRDDGGLHISRDAPDDWTRRFNRWTTVGKSNPFTGTDELREAYFSDLALVETRVAAGDCPSCEVTRVMGSYKIKLRELTDP